MTIMITEGINKTINQIENSKIPLAVFLVNFVFICIIRNYFEVYSDQVSCFKLECYAHYNYGFFWLATILILVFHLFLNEKVEKLAKIILTGFLIIWMAPLLDILISGGSDKMSYIEPGFHKNILMRFITFWGNYDGKTGATPGIRIEIALALLGCFYYGYFYKKISFIKSLSLAFLTYISIFMYGMFPFLSSGFLNFFSIPYDYISYKMHSYYFLILIFINGILLFYSYKKEYFLEIVKDLRYLRVFYYLLIMTLGIFLGLKQIHGQDFKFEYDLFFKIILTTLSLIFAILFSLITNNIADLEIDSLSSPKRPSVSGSIPQSFYKKLALLSFVGALIYSANAGFAPFFTVLVFLSSYFVYSMPPLRLKRIPLFSKAFITLNSLALLSLGKYFIIGKLNLSSEIVIFFILVMTPVFNFIDLKDYEGDFKAGIKTLPTLLGLKKAQRLMGGIFLLAHILFFFILKNSHPIPNWTFLLFLIFGLLHFYFLNRTNFQEKWIFITFFFSVSVTLPFLT